jgi:replication factor C subunit 3/5
MSNGTPFMESYRPKKFEDIVLDPFNKKILTNIIETIHFPNLLFYGPPGTGKTTTIINLINAYQEKIGIKNKDLVIHLNASDERGIDIIRNQISFFVNSKPLFNKGMKFVILDEVDYMTKNAEQALKYLLQNYTGSVRFCLICNYISKIDEGLQNEFIKLRFNQLPKNDIIQFLKNISDNEKLYFSNEVLTLIQQMYKSDIRSMVNYMQSNQDIIQMSKLKKTNISAFHIIDNSIWESLIERIKQTKIDEKTKMDEINAHIYNISVMYNIDKKNIIKNFFNYIIRNKPTIVNSKFLSFVENIIHSQNNNYHNVCYLTSRMSSFL